MSDWTSEEERVEFLIRHVAGVHVWLKAKNSFNTKEELKNKILQQKVRHLCAASRCYQLGRS